MFYCLLFFFFKQKTAYEMRISDWSSDVCSSDLVAVILLHPGFEDGVNGASPPRGTGVGVDGVEGGKAQHLARIEGERVRLQPVDVGHSNGARPDSDVGRRRRLRRGAIGGGPVERPRSEEHTYELQSLMRTS